MKTVYIEEDEFPLWDAFVASHPSGTIYHRSDWKRVLEKAFSHIKGRFLVLADSDTDQILAGMPIYEVKSWIFGNRLICVPFSNWCDPLVSNNQQLTQLLAETRNLAQRLSSKRIELKSLANHTELPKGGWEIQAKWKHNTIVLDRNEPELWESLSQTAVRQMIKRAEKNNVEIRIDNSQDAMKQFYDALLRTRKRLRLPMIPYPYFSAMQQVFSKGVCKVFIASKNGETIAAALTLTDKGICHLELTGEFPKARKLGAMQLLVWKAVQEAQNNACEQFSFGRTAADNQGLLQYKRRWNTLEENLYVLAWNRDSNSKSSGSNSISDSVSKILMRLLPRPLYKLLGNYIYSHWG